MQNMEIEKEVQVSVIVPNYNYARYLANAYRVNS